MMPQTDTLGTGAALYRTKLSVDVFKSEQKNKPGIFLYIIGMV